MYKKFFGFKERPFQLVPNPAYLFLSKCHEEAMAHLSYAISQGDGFVEITGEWDRQDDLVQSFSRPNRKGNGGRVCL
jgi:hypothetical protein